MVPLVSSIKDEVNVVGFWYLMITIPEPPLPPSTRLSVVPSDPPPPPPPVLAVPAKPFVNVCKAPLPPPPFPPLPLILVGPVSPAGVAPIEFHVPPPPPPPK